MTTERRNSLRQRCLLGARIMINGGKSTMNCVIRNQSAGGALLALPEPIAIPTEFPLLIDKHSAGATAHVAWRSGKMVGVAFREEGVMDRMRDMAGRREAAHLQAARDASVRRDAGY
jgi:hypothetical protein